MSTLTVWQYRVTSDGGGWLADVVLRSDGFFATVSDWGCHAYRWNSFSGSFRVFVAGITPDYVASKLEGRYADGFAQKVWPRLVALVRAELAAESPSAPADEPALPPGVISFRAEKEKREMDPNNLPEDGDLRVGHLRDHPGWALLHVKNSEGDVTAVLDPDTLSEVIDTLVDIESEGPNARVEEDS